MVHPDIRKLDPREDHFWTAAPQAGLELFLRHLEPERRVDQAVRPVLYVHGATFPSGLSIAHRFDGWSWRDALCEAGFDVWAFDFLGYGHSSRYLEMSEPPEANPALLRARDASAQVEAVVRFVLKHHGVPDLSIISHSWGSMPACLAACRHPTLIERLVLFAPIARRPPRRYEKPPSALAWRFVSLEDQWARFVEDQPKNEPPVLSRRHFEEWGKRYLDSDPESRTRNPAAVKTPTGPLADILHAWHGELGYEPAEVQASVAIIRGAWDGLIPDEDARWLFDAFTGAPMKRDIKIGRATHLMHLESMRFALYRESIAFLQGNDKAPVAAQPERHKTRQGA
jgi:pimeloyl-ACP methyl ester carboxylesterase